MDEQARGTTSIAAIVEDYLGSWVDDDSGPSGPVPARDGAWRVRSVILLLDQGFPEHMIHEVLWCSEKDAREMVDAIRGHLPDRHSMRAFLEKRSRRKRPRSADEDSRLSLDSEDVKQALNMLEYWTDHWLQEYQGKP